MIITKRHSNQTLRETEKDTAKKNPSAVTINAYIKKEERRKSIKITFHLKLEKKKN